MHVVTCEMREPAVALSGIVPEWGRIAAGDGLRLAGDDEEDDVDDEDDEEDDGEGEGEGEDEGEGQ